ncbi:Hypothetical protein ORPV_997 [Orpheovirus IHUMI-LCC2]|uniref:Uncharacterized protein n=1 Tax=Orpheovirus IHUMI-LCC2 TaxID=2023057 RepID=A0A2I2L5V9_9VIRU|nr:Hypothetical protein ORPV_997 [Orpheovirus IHUMI-LCC2]SNW62901.1 Hypothetical protein ORPV_997 [Orpheovirus IHUMI-LCC2]
MQEEEYYTKLFLDSILLTNDNLNLNHREEILQTLYNHHAAGHNITPNLIYMNKRLYTGYFFRNNDMDLYKAILPMPTLSEFNNDDMYNKVVEDYLVIDFVLRNPKILKEEPFRSCLVEIYEKTTWESLYIHVSDILSIFYPNLFKSLPFQPYIEIKYENEGNQEVNYCDIYPLLCQIKNGKDQIPDEVSEFLQEKFGNEMDYIVV